KTFAGVLEDALGDGAGVTVMAGACDGGERKVREAGQPALLKSAPAEADEQDESGQRAEPRSAGSYLSEQPGRRRQEEPTVAPEPVEVEYGDDLDIPDFLR